MLDVPDVPDKQRTPDDPPPQAPPDPSAVRPVAIIAEPLPAAVLPAASVITPDRQVVQGPDAGQAMGKFRVPGAIRRPPGDLTKAMIWLHGPPKIGKTTLAAKFPGAWFWATERGQDWVEVREPTFIHSWAEFLELCAFVQETRPTHFADGTPIRVIVIDVLDILFKMCQEAVCGELGIEDPGELPHGKAWSRLTAEFERVMTKIRKWPYGLICISHSRSKEIKIKAQKVPREEPYIGAAGMRWGAGAADLILYAFTKETAVKDKVTGAITGQIEEQRCLLCHPQSWALAGGRMVEQRGIPEIIPLDYNELVSYFPETPKETGRIVGELLPTPPTETAVL